MHPNLFLLFQCDNRYSRSRDQISLLTTTAAHKTDEQIQETKSQGQWNNKTSLAAVFEKFEKNGMSFTIHEIVFYDTDA